MNKIIIPLFVSFFLISCGKSEEIRQERSVNVINSWVIETWSIEIWSLNTNTWFIEKIETNNSTPSVPENTWTEVNIDELSLIDFTDSRIDSKSLSEYKQMLTELSNEPGPLYELSISQTKILNKYSKLLLRLFNQGLLPTLKTFKIGNNEYFVTAWFVSWIGEFPKKEDFWSWNVSCGTVSVSWGEYHWTCILINKENGNIIIDSNFWLEDASWEQAFEIIQWKYLLSSWGDWDSCVASTSYSLFDSNLKNISVMNILYNWCYWMERTFTKWDSAISFNDPAQSDDQKLAIIQEKWYESWNWYESWDFSSLTFSNTFIPWEFFEWHYLNSKYFLYTQDSKFRLDIVKNLLNWKLFQFTIDGKDIELDPDNESKWNAANQYKLVLSMKKIPDGYEVSGSKFGLDSMNIKSCKDNGNEYDNNLFSPKSLDKEKGTFTYRISTKFGNVCKIPYEFIYKLRNDDKSYSEKVEVVFP